MLKNTPQAWDKAWKTNLSTEEDIFNITKEGNSIRFQRIEKIVLNRFESFNNLKVIEIGSGVGTNAALMAKRGAEITILDYSEKAIERAREFFKRNRLDAKYITQNALSITKKLFDRYDISMSFGLAEHFSDHERMKIINTHLDVLKKGGIAFISVPNKYNPPYRTFMFLKKIAGRLTIEEYPFSRRELKNICESIGFVEYSFLGDSLFSSLNFINPLEYLRWVFNKRKSVKDQLNQSHIRKEKGTFLDQYLSYALVIVLTKDSLR